MSIAINFLGQPVPEGWIELDEKARYAEIAINDFHEHMVIPTDFWTPAQYSQHWLEALERILARESTKSALITQIHDPATANFITWWPIYREDETIYVYNQLVFTDQLPQPFQADNPYQHIPDRQEFLEGEETISEWTVPVASLRLWHEQLKRPV